MNEIEMLYFEKEQKDIKAWCIQHNQILKYRNKNYYLYLNTIYDENMNIVVEDAGNGFLDLYEYYEYFPQNK